MQCFGRVPARERLIHDGTREDIEHMLTEVIREVRTPIREEAANMKIIT